MSLPAIERSHICAVVVTYFPKADCADNLAALAPQVGKLIIVDNGSSAESLEPVEAAAQRLGATVVHLGSNLGIATALNIGLRLAREQGFRWLATFDQDSQATPGMIEEMTRAFESYPQRDKVGIVTPRHVDRRLGFIVRDRGGEAKGEGWRVIPSTMTSGNLLNVAIATAVGGFDDSLFIDYVDHELCLRLRGQGCRILEATRATLLHSLGSMERRLFIFKHVTVTNHSVVRRYYMSRNRLIVWRRYLKHEPLWVIRDIRRFLFETLYVVLYEKQVREKFPMILHGLRDGLRNVRGAFDPGKDT
jgi:rhamnosyltransferase